MHKKTAKNPIGEVDNFMSQEIKGNSVFMADEDAVLFLKYMKHRDKFISLLTAGVFDLESGKVEVNLNNNMIQSVYLYHMTYKKSKSL